MNSYSCWFQQELFAQTFLFPLLWDCYFHSYIWVSFLPLIRQLCLYNCSKYRWNDCETHFENFYFRWLLFGIQLETFKGEDFFRGYQGIKITSVASISFPIPHSPFLSVIFPHPTSMISLFLFRVSQGKKNNNWHSINPFLSFFPFLPQSAEDLEKRK